MGIEQIKLWTGLRRFVTESVLEAFEVSTDYEDIQAFRRSAIRFILIFFILVMVLNFIATKTFNPSLTYHDGISSGLCLTLTLIILNLKRMKRFFWLWLALMSTFFGYVCLMGVIDQTGIQVGAMFLTVIMPIVGVHFIGRLGAIGCWLMASATYVFLLLHSLSLPPPEVYFGGYSQIYDLLIMAFLALTFSLIISLTLHEAILTALTTARRNLRRAHASEKERLRFFGAVSHEVRNSINGVFGITSSLLQDDLSDDVRNKVELIQASGNSLVRVLNDTLEITRLESNSMQILSECIDLQHMLTQMSSRWQMSAAGKGLSFFIQLSPEIPTKIMSDAGRIGQVLDNLLSNALKFTQSGSICLSVSSVETVNDRTILQFDVTDTGCGIHIDRQARIFEPYRQADEDTYLHFGGTGLGLYICRLIAVQMGGTVELVQSDSTSTTFRYCVPVELCAPDNQACDTPDEIRVGNIKDFRILAVDDRAPNLRYLQTLFTAWDLDLETVNSGSDCLQKMQSAQFDLILLDLNMPNMGGVELLTHIRNLPSPVCDITAIIISADVDEDRRRQLTDLDANIFLAKPVTPDMLWTALLQATSKHSEKKLSA